MKWIERCELLLNDDLNTKDMIFITGWNHTKIKELRLKIVAEQIEKGEPLYDHRRIPTELFLKKIGKTYKGFELKAERQVRLNKFKTESEK